MCTFYVDKKPPTASSLGCISFLPQHSSSQPRASERNPPPRKKNPAKTDNPQLEVLWLELWKFTTNGKFVCADLINRCPSCYLCGKRTLSVLQSLPALGWTRWPWNFKHIFMVWKSPMWEVCAHTNSHPCKHTHMHIQPHIHLSRKDWFSSQFLV